MKFQLAIFHRGSGAGISSDVPEPAAKTIAFDQEPHAWRRWLEWMPKVELPPLPTSGSPFTSPANTPLHQRVFLNGTATEVSFK